MRMRIATMVTGHFTCPLPKGIIYAPMLIAKSVAEGLTKKGHEVKFFAPIGSHLKVTKVISDGLEPLNPRINKSHKILKDKKIDQSKVASLWDQYLISLIYQEALSGKIDLIHVHPIDRALPFGLAIKNVPVVYTLHDPVYPWRAEAFKMFESKNQYLVSISDSQRKPAPDLNWAATIYNGLDLSLFPFSAKPKNHFLFLGRILPEKGPDIAIRAARLAKEKLDIVGLPDSGKYWEEKIKPFLGKNISYLGNLPYEKTARLYGQAKALLCPIQWEEPFGLTFIEAMACGTPVIVFDRGSAGEVVKDGKTGFVVKNTREMMAAMKKINQIKRADCRQWVKENFTIEKMVERYEEVFSEILASRKKIK